MCVDVNFKHDSQILINQDSFPEIKVESVEKYIYNAKLYSDYDVTGRQDFGSSNLQPFQLDSYGVLDLRIGAKFNLGSLGAYAQVQGYNVLDELYWARGIEGNKNLKNGFPSYGRTLNFSVKLTF